jgi:hypothetical protein
MNNQSLRPYLYAWFQALPMQTTKLIKTTIMEIWVMSEAKTVRLNSWVDDHRDPLKKILSDNQAHVPLSEANQQLILELVRLAIAEPKVGRPRLKFRDLKKKEKLIAAVHEVERRHCLGENYNDAREAVGKEFGFSKRHLQKFKWIARIPIRIATVSKPLTNAIARIQSVAPRFPQSPPGD